jgi:hypothetical protein
MRPQRLANMVQKQPRFPNRRPDGSFCVEVTLRVESAEIEPFVSRLTAWLNDWAKANRYWKPGFSHPESRDGVFDFQRDFTGPPSCSTQVANLVRLRLEGRPESKRTWKDWLCMKLLPELRRVFAEIRAIEKIQDCPDVSREHE